MKRGKAVALGAAGIVGTLGIWEWIARSGLISAQTFPPATVVIDRLISELGQSQIWNATITTLAQAAVSIAICIVFAVPLGVLVGRVPITDRLTRSTIDFLRAMPGIALVPLFLLFIGATNEMVVLLAAFVAFWPLLIQTIEGARSVEELALDMGRSFRLTGPQRFFRVILPATTPSIMTGLRLSASIALLVTIGAGLLSGAPGVGQLIARSNISDDGLGVFAFAVWSGILGVTVLTILRLVDSRVLSWHYARTGMERAA